jgi:excisionase family DNA binding protein
MSSSISSRISELAGALEERGIYPVAAELRDLANEVKDNRLLTLAEAAEYLQIADDELRELLRSGDLPYVQIGKHVRINIREVLELKRR